MSPFNSVHFPFEYRAGQKKDDCRSISDDCQTQKIIYGGVDRHRGKTISAIFPAMKAMGGGMAEKIFYPYGKNNHAGLLQKKRISC